MNGLNAWNHVVGMVQPITVQFVFWSAQSCMVLPCCSYTAQNAPTMKHATQIAPTRSHSSFVSGSLACVFVGAAACAAVRCASTSGARYLPPHR